MYRKWEKDLEICLKRFVACEKAVNDWSHRGGGNMLVFTFLNREGDTTIGLPPHPFIKSFLYDRVKGKNVVEEKPLSTEEIGAFKTCFGEPLAVPKNLLTSVSIKDFLETVNNRKELIRECLAFTPHSRFRNYYTKGKKP